jgi:hypothetical protein
MAPSSVPTRAIFFALALLACIARRRRSRCCQPPRVWCLRHIQKGRKRAR